MLDGGWYYLHTDGSLIHKRFEPESDSPFVTKVWNVDTTDRLCAWRIATEALALGASADRIKELAKRWGLTLNDLVQYLQRVKEPTNAMREDVHRFLDVVYGVDSNDYYDRLAKTPKGSQPDMEPLLKRVDVEC